MAAILFVLSICLVLCPFVSAQCNMYASKSECEMYPYTSGCSGNCCWWTTSNGCIDLNYDCSTTFYDQTSCNADSNNGCIFDSSMNYCTTSYCLYEGQSNCESMTDGDATACSWDNSKLICIRGSGGGGGGGGTSDPTCASYGSTDCTPDKLQGTCILSNYDNNQDKHDMPNCQNLQDLCEGMGGTDEANCGGSYYAISNYDFMPWCYYDKTAGSCVASNCHQKKDETSCNSACDADGEHCHWYDPSNYFYGEKSEEVGDATAALGCRRACALGYSSPDDNDVNGCDNVDNDPNFADHCEGKSVMDEWDSLLFDTCRYKAGTLTGQCTILAGPKTCPDYVEASECYDGGCKFNATGCFPYDSPEEKQAAEAKVAWQAEIDRCHNFTNASTCFDGDCKTNSTGCFPYVSDDEKAAAKELAAKEAACKSMGTAEACYTAGCDFDSNNALCSAYVCGQQGTLSSDQDATVVQVLGTHWFGLHGLACALQEKPIGGTKELRVQLDANVVAEYVQPAHSTGICLRSLGSTHECSNNHSVVVDPLFNRLVVTGVRNITTGARPRLSGGHSARSGFDVETDLNATRKVLTLEGLELVNGKMIDPPSSEAVYTWSVVEASEAYPGSYSWGTFDSNNFNTLKLLKAARGIHHQNIAHAGGASVRLVASNFTAKDVLFSGNVARMSKEMDSYRETDDLRVTSSSETPWRVKEVHVGGGAVYATLKSFVELMDSNFEFNTADRAGAVFVGCESFLVAANVRFENNSALPSHSWAAGGAVLFSGGYAASKHYISSSGDLTAEKYLKARADQHCAIGLHPASKNIKVEYSTNSMASQTFLNTERDDSNEGLGDFKDCVFLGNRIVSQSSWEETSSVGSEKKRNLVKEGGGAIYSNVALMIKSSNFLENSATCSTDGASSGGAVLARDYLDVSKTTFRGNSAVEGGAIMVDSYFTAFTKHNGPTHLIRECHFDSNKGKLRTVTDPSGSNEDDQSYQGKTIEYRDSLCDQYDKELCLLETESGLNLVKRTVCSKKSSSNPTDPILAICKEIGDSGGYHDTSSPPWCIRSSVGTPCRTSWYPKGAQQIISGSSSRQLEFHEMDMSIAHLYNKFWDSQYCGCIPTKFDGTGSGTENMITNTMNTWAAKITPSGHGDGICYPKTTTDTTSPMFLPSLKVIDNCTANYITAKTDCPKFSTESTCYQCGKCMWTVERDTKHCVPRASQLVPYAPYDFKCNADDGLEAYCNYEYDNELGMCRIKVDPGSSSISCGSLPGRMCNHGQLFESITQPFFQARRERNSKYRKPCADCSRLAPSDCAQCSSCERKHQCGRDQSTTDSLLLQHCTFSPTNTMAKPGKEETYLTKLENVYRTNLLKCADVGDKFCASGECADRLETSSEASYGPVCACPAGTYGNLSYGNGTDGCINCPAGQYREAGDLDPQQPLRVRFATAPCKSCPAGWAADEGSPQCSFCDTGRYIDQHTVTCQDCAAGKYKATSQTTIERLEPCKFCALGFAASVDNTNCTECQPGRYADNSLLAVAPVGCSLCPKGYWQGATGKGSCVACKENEYSNQTGSNSMAYCEACEQHKESPAGSESCTNILIQEFNIENTQTEVIEGDEYILTTSFFTNQANDELFVNFTTSDNALCPLSKSSIAIQGTATEKNFGSVNIQTRDNSIDEPNKKCTINVTATIANGTTLAKTFEKKKIVLTIQEDDTAGIHTATPQNKRTVVQKEGTGAFEYNVTLTSEPKDSNVVVAMVWGNADDDYAPNRINIRPENVTFTSTTWSTPQVVRIEPIDDNIKFDATLYTLQHNPTSTEFGYKSIATAENENIYCLVDDNDVPGITSVDDGASLNPGGTKTIKFNLATLHKDSRARLVINVDVTPLSIKKLITVTSQTVIVTQDNWTDTHSISLALDASTTTEGTGYIVLKVTDDHSKNAQEYNNIKSESIPFTIEQKDETFEWHKTTTGNGPILSFANDSRLTVNWTRPATVKGVSYTGLFNVMFDETPQQPNCTIGPTKNIATTTITVDTCLPLVHSTFVARVQLAAHPEQQTDPSVEKWSTIAKETQKKEGLVTLGQHFSKCRPGKQFLNHRPTGESPTNLDFLSTWACQTCPMGESNCNETVAWKDLRPAMGWWCPSEDLEWARRCLDIAVQSDADASNRCRFYKCPYPEACIGQQWINGTTAVATAANNQSQARCGNCKQGHRGMLCSICEEGYTRDMYGACQFCSAPPATIATGLGILGIVAATLFLLVFLTMVKTSKAAMKKAREQKQEEEENDPEKNKEADAHTAQVSNAGRNFQNSTTVTSGKSRTFGRSLSSKSKILLGFIQVFTALNVTYDVPWPGPMVDLMNTFSFVNLDMMGLLGGSLCSFALSFLDGFLVQLCVPLMLALVSFLSYIAASTCCATGKHKQEGRHAAQSVGVVFLSTATFCIYPSLAMKIFQVFRCDKVVEYGNIYYLQADYSVQCWSETHMPYVIVSVVCIFLFVLGIPFVTFVVLFKNRKLLNDEHVQKRYGSLYMQYENNWWYFELLDTLRRMLLTGGLVLAGAGTVGQIIAGTLVSLFFLLLTTRVSPFRSDLDDFLSFVCNLQQVLLYVVGLGLKSQQDGAGGTASSNGTFSNTMFVFVVNGLTITVVVIGLLTILSIPCGDKFERLLKRCQQCGGRGQSGGKKLQKVSPLPPLSMEKRAAVRNWDQ